jgi:hypothetical protein
MYVAKFSSTGALLWHTFVGFEENDWGKGIAIDKNGDVFALGEGYSYLTYQGHIKILLAKLSPNGTLGWVIVGGGINSEYYTDLAIDSQGNIYTVGYSGGSTFGTPINPPQGNNDAMVMKFSPNGDYRWHTFLGGSMGDEGNGIAVDSIGNIYVVGESYTGWGIPIRPNSDNSPDGFLAKLDTNGYRQWHTFLGGPLYDFATDLRLDPYGNILVVGASADTWESPLSPHTAAIGFDAFVAKLGSDGILQWNSFFGEVSQDEGYGIAIGNNQDVYITGFSGYVWGNPINNFGGEASGGFSAKIAAPETFDDVVLNYWAHDYIQSLYTAGITGGCQVNPLAYCPDGMVTRAQMAIFLLKGIHGSSYSPPAVESGTGFSDVDTDHWAAKWIKQLAVEQITGGCASGEYCPDSAVTRAQMAIFLLKAKHGASYNPPAVGSSTGFGDVPTTHWAAKWIKQLAAEGITGGCGSGNYCPDTAVTRAQMAVFLVKAFAIP